MSIGDRCYFCLNKKAKFILHKETKEELHLCSSCNKQYQEILTNTDDKSILELPHNDPSDVCTKCGLCCVMLCAKVEQEEAERFLQEARRMNIFPQDITFEQFCTKSETVPYKGDYLINTPCRYLQGSILKYTSCRAYHLNRPSVCSSYLCKIAVEYKIGRITQDQARFSLRSAFMEGVVEVFNWTESLVFLDGYEDRISLLSRISDIVAELKKANIDDDLIELTVASAITPDYIPSSDVCRALFNMHLFNVDRDDYDLKLYIPEMLKGLNVVEKEIALKVVKCVLRDIRKLFIREDEGFPKVPDGVSMGCGQTEHRCSICDGEWDGKRDSGEGNQGA